MVCVQTSRQPFVFQRLQVLVVEIVGYRDEFLVPLVPSSRLVASDQQDRMATRIKREQDPGISGRTRSDPIRVLAAAGIGGISYREPSGWSLRVQSM